MANTNVFRGSDATISFSPTEVELPEGEAANTVIEFHEISTVGRATEVEVFINTELEEFHEVGRRHPAQLRPGNIHINGRMKRAFINGALVQLLLGRGAQTEREAEPYAQPSFILQFQVEDPAHPGTRSVLSVHGVKMQNWAFNLPEDDFVMEEVSFKGMFITIGDAEGA